jgi:hypothetical protein
MTTYAVGTIYYYDADDSEASYPDADMAARYLPPGSVMELGRIQELTPKWGAMVVLTRTEDGSPDEVELRLFDTEAEALTAVAAPPRSSGDEAV